VDEKIEIEAHLVSELHFDEPVSAGAEPRFFKNHLTVSVTAQDKKGAVCVHVNATPRALSLQLVPVAVEHLNWYCQLNRSQTMTITTSAISDKRGYPTLPL
jgi:hypothetical protein